MNDRSSPLTQKRVNTKGLNYIEAYINYNNISHGDFFYTYDGSG